jgi:hypothetical protein
MKESLREAKAGTNYKGIIYTHYYHTDN